ncbi:ubiquinone biosynthesis O-methyltransferase, mitochondrial [Anthonomus grandis grandis]|uniref:ubiquinone biosynthesis O-methyltransferase, mitochondrial n=1 Tax=Anthonomus grandis grandis TaxID=2921223 RepID=UPI002165608D|nr:ubiquinone biosynthesis O-methyltransferase, mitochondrial [Anthonomus grandis grandis]
MALLVTCLRTSPRFPKLSQNLIRQLGTIDHQEVKQFDQMSTEWWSESGGVRPLHTMNKLRIPMIRDGLINEGAVPLINADSATPLKGLSILDVGCGGGIMTEALARLGATVTGIDASPKIIDVAKQHAAESQLNINYIATSIEEYGKLNSEKFDAVAASEIIEHVTEKEKFLSACSTCLKPSGSIFVTTINKTFMSELIAIYFAENILEMIPKGTHHIDKCIEPHKLQRILEDNNLRTKLVHGMCYNFITNNWSWSSNKSISYGIHAVKIKN